MRAIRWRTRHANGPSDWHYELVPEWSTNSREYLSERVEREARPYERGAEGDVVYRIPLAARQQIVRRLRRRIASAHKEIKILEAER